MLSTEVLVVDQVTSVWRDNFAVHNGQGAVLGQIRTEGGLGSRLLMGNREFAVYDTEGTLLMRLNDVPNLGRDRFRVTDGQDRQLAEVVKEISFFKPRLSIRLVEGGHVDVRGDFFDFNYQIDSGGHPLARVARSWPGLAGSLLGRDRYVIGFEPQATDPIRLAVLGTTLALDLIRAKERRSNN